MRQPSTGLIERNEELGLEKYAKPAGIIASLIPMTNPALTPPVTEFTHQIQVTQENLFPHPRTKQPLKWLKSCERFADMQMPQRTFSSAYPNPLFP